MGFDLTGHLVAFLQERPDEKFSAKDLASWIFAAFPDEFKKRRGKGAARKTDDQLIRDIMAQIGANRLEAMQARDPQVQAEGFRPRLFWWSQAGEDTGEEDSEDEDESLPPRSVSPEPTTRPSSEHELYPLLRDYLRDKLKVYALRIDEKTSSNRRGPGYNQWLHPDLTGIEDLTRALSAETRGLAFKAGGRTARLWSFEVKVRLASSNVREAFFQTVSNSSWANVGYLAAAEIADDRTMAELRMLHGAHGVGLIWLNIDDPMKSEILIPARERHEVDWVACDRLSQENPDFKSYLALVGEFHTLEKLKPSDWAWEK